jgi:hypothetical protein
MRPHNFSIVECIVFHDTAISHADMLERNQIITCYTDPYHSHYLMKGKCNLPVTWKNHILLTHTWRDVNWCIHRMRSQWEYHNHKSVDEEILDLFDYLEIPLGETRLFMRELEKNRGNMITSFSQQSNHAVVSG